MRRLHHNPGSRNGMGATGKVTLNTLPDDFPTAEQVRTREFKWWRQFDSSPWVSSSHLLRGNPVGCGYDSHEVCSQAISFSSNWAKFKPFLPSLLNLNCQLSIARLICSLAFLQLEAARFILMVWFMFDGMIHFMAWKRSVLHND